MVDREWIDGWFAPMRPYAALMKQFIDGRVAADEFETVFLSLCKFDDTQWTSQAFDVLEALFADVDDYCGDADLLAEAGGIGEKELRSKAGLALADLARIADRSVR